jgi:16S rRNA (guanine527-N7)-methyltransferase
MGEQEERRRNSHLERDLLELERLLKPYSLEIGELARDRILAYAKELIAWNDRFNLLSRSDTPNVIRKHVAASIGVFLVVQPSPWDRWIDVGTGAGFPGLVLKIMRPDLQITLLDSARKRCLFLENTLRLLELGKVPILPLRVETLISREEGLGTYTVLTSRAVASLAETITGFGPLVALEGRIVTFKGPQWLDELNETQAAGILSREGFELEATTRIPWTAGHLLSFRKVR